MGNVSTEVIEEGGTERVEVTCGACGTEVPAAVPQGTEFTDHAPAGIVEVDCPACSETVAVGYTYEE